MKWTRRDMLKGLGGLPLVGGIWWAAAANSVLSNEKRTEILEHLNIEPSYPTLLPPIDGSAIKVGIIGFGIRGEQLCRSLVFATKEWLSEMRNAADESPKH